MPSVTGFFGARCNRAVHGPQGTATEEILADLQYLEARYRSRWRSVAGQGVGDTPHTRSTLSDTPANQRDEHDRLPATPPSP